MNRWDVARKDLTCHRCQDPIIAGEQYRHFGPKNWPTCIGCAKKATGEDPPADMPEIPTLPTLKPLDQWFEPNDGLPPIGSIVPVLASASQRERILRARRRLEQPDMQQQRIARDWWND